MTRLIEPVLDGNYRCVDYVKDLAKIQEHLEGGAAASSSGGEASEKFLLYLEQALIFESLGESKLVRQSLESARKAAVSDQQRLVLEHWDRLYRKERVGLSSEPLRKQSGSFSEEPQSDGVSVSQVINGSESSSRRPPCECCKYSGDEATKPEKSFPALKTGLVEAAEDVVILTVEGHFVACSRERMADLSGPFCAMLKGEYQESRTNAIPFDFNGLTPAGLQAVERFSRTGCLEEGPGATCERWVLQAKVETDRVSLPTLIVPQPSDEDHSSSDESSIGELSESEDEEEPPSPRRCPVSSNETSSSGGGSQVFEWPQSDRAEPSFESDQANKESGQEEATGSSTPGQGTHRMTLSKRLRREFSGGFGKGMKIRVGSNGDLKALDLESEDEQATISTQSSHDELCTDTVVEVLRFANRFFCEGLKAHCDERLVRTVNTSSDIAATLAFALEESCPQLTARCLKLIFEKLPQSLTSEPDLTDLLLGEEGRRQLELSGFASYVFYMFLAHAFRENLLGPLSRNQPFRKSRAFDLAIACLSAANSYPTLPSLRGFASYQLGCLHLIVKNHEDAEIAFNEALGAGYAPAKAGLARVLAQKGDRLNARQEISSLLTDGEVPAGWIYQERALCSDGSRKREDLETATRLCPTLTYPYKYRTARLLKEQKPLLALAEMDHVLQFLVTADLLEFRVYCCLALENYTSAVRDLRVLLTLEPRYMLYGGRVSASQFLKELSKKVAPQSKGECWLQLYDRWSAVDDFGSLAAVHKMLEDEPGKAAALFRQSLLLHRIGCSTAAMRTLRQARDHATSEQERLVYEGWILYDTGSRTEALQKAQMSVSLAPSFEGYFLQAYALSELLPSEEDPSAVVELLKKALNCPSDGLRKGQALNNLGGVYVDMGRHAEAAECYTNALRIRHTRAHQGLARVHALRGDRRQAYEEMSALIASSRSNACAYEKRSEYCPLNQGLADLDAATERNPVRTYPYRYRAAVMMDTLREEQAIQELSRAIAFKVDASLLHLRAEFHECQRDLEAARRDARAALAVDPNNRAIKELWKTKLEVRGGRLLP